MTEVCFLILEGKHWFLISVACYQEDGDGDVFGIKIISSLLHFIFL